MILDELQDLLGVVAAQRFIDVFAATVVTVPKHPTGAFFGRLVQLAGPEAAERLRLRFAGETIYVPLNVADERKRRDDEIAARLAAGESPAAIARSYRTMTRLSIRHVQRIAAGAAKHGVVPKALKP